jgi:hypothetical protein
MPLNHCRHIKEDGFFCQGPPGARARVLSLPPASARPPHENGARALAGGSSQATVTCALALRRRLAVSLKCEEELLCARTVAPSVRPEKLFEKQLSVARLPVVRLRRLALPANKGSPRHCAEGSQERGDCFT